MVRVAKRLVGDNSTNFALLALKKTDHHPTLSRLTLSRPRAACQGVCSAVQKAHYQCGGSGACGAALSRQHGCQVPGPPTVEGEPRLHQDSTAGLGLDTLTPSLSFPCFNHPAPTQTASETDFEHASEGMEKYVTSKLYRYLFQPETSDENMRDQVHSPVMMHCLSFCFVASSPLFLFLFSCRHWPTACKCCPSSVQRYEHCHLLFSASVFCFF